jgi:hypothetical protein
VARGVAVIARGAGGPGLASPHVAPSSSRIVRA